jgi:hypothetical protein
MHRPRQDYQKENIAALERTDSREYGRSVVDFFRVGDWGLGTRVLARERIVKLASTVFEQQHYSFSRSLIAIFFSENLVLFFQA